MDILFRFHKGVHKTLTGVHPPGDGDVPGGLGHVVVLLDGGVNGRGVLAAPGWSRSSPPSQTNTKD